MVDNIVVSGIEFEVLAVMGLVRVVPVEYDVATV